MSATGYGIGIYTAPEAARMVGMNTATLKRWLIGYDHEGKHETELWQPQHTLADDGLLLGFRDLVEARIVNALRRRRFSLQTIRICIARARAIVGDERPFSTKQFKTDGKAIFLEITHNLDEPYLVELKKGQGFFKVVVEPSLQDLDFEQIGAARWWLLPGKRSIVADPLRSFGQPIMNKVGMTTARAVEIVKAEGSIILAAKAYDVPPALLRDALAYEHQIHSRRAA